jgi:hypothetical protein
VATSDARTNEQQFRNVGPFTIDGEPVIEIERDQKYSKNLGKLWIGSTWITLEQARELHHWLTEALPALEQARG